MSMVVKEIDSLISPTLVKIHSMSRTASYVFRVAQISTMGRPDVEAMRRRLRRMKEGCTNSDKKTEDREYGRRRIYAGVGRTEVFAHKGIRSTPLHLASYGGYIDVARMLIEYGADLTAKDKTGMTPLHLASYRGHVDVTRMLIELGVDLTAQNNEGETPLHLASQEGGVVEVAHMLIERGADLTAQDSEGETPLHLALDEGQVDVARVLIECGVDLTARDDDGMTPLHLASASWAEISPQEHAEFVHRCRRQCPE